MLKHPQYTRQRFQVLLQQVQKRIYGDCQLIESLQVSGPVDRITCSQAQQLEYSPASVGMLLGPNWATYWFKAQATVPAAWAGSRVDLLWETGGEACLWIDGRSIQGLNSRIRDPRTEARLINRAEPDQTISFTVEAACNSMFGLRSGSGLVEETGPVTPYALTRADIARFDEQVWRLYHDLKLLVDLEAGLSTDGQDPSWAGRLLGELNRVCNLIDLDDRTTWPAAQAIIDELYQHRNGTHAHELSAIGHAHIDTAWLWPLAETYRKCVRTFSTALRLMDEYPQYKFACSQAFQYRWIKRRNPDLYSRIKAAHQRGQWVPVGGTWIEPDCNLPSGESLCRQFLMGQRYFEAEFGRRCREFWNPDVFGYNGQLPQIMRQAGITRFLTQKLSWNRFNAPRHHTFTWRGVDGSEVLAHFPPADTYNAMADVAEFRRHVSKHKDHDRSREAFMLFGYGDGGGGPTRVMLENIKRAGDLQGLPRVTMRSSEEFFDRLQADCQDLPMCIGELYFELHRGTYTTQAAIKRGNRKGEWLLHDLDLAAALAHRLSKSYEFPSEPLHELWAMLLLNQFHDILPGSSIDQVNEQARREYEQLQQDGSALCRQAQDALASALSEQSKVDTSVQSPWNTLGVERCEVTATPDGSLTKVSCPSCGIGQTVQLQQAVALMQTSHDRWTMSNRHLQAEITAAGSIVSLIHLASRRQCLADAANVLEIYDDQPANWDAWDIEPSALETGKPCPPAHEAAVHLQNDLRVELRFERRVGKASTMTQMIRLDADSPRLEVHSRINWQENHRMLKAAFPVQVLATDATYEMQYQAVQRPTHYTNSYDLAKYEVPGHRFVDLSEHGFGVALLSESKYGFNTIDNVMRMTLLRATCLPDPMADRGEHGFAYALYPHQGDWRDGGVVAEAMRFNNPVRWLSGTLPQRSFFTVDDPNLILDSIKRTEDSRGLLLRLYEAHGGRGVARLTCGLPFSEARYCNILEDPGDSLQLRDGAMDVTYQPHQLISIILR
ncbi:MAG: alpha-mannosidase [Phycisphaeraceae bacterium]|nr:alpha-mannosidase [Phycisphaeraceae bacterium]